MAPILEELPKAARAAQIPETFTLFQNFQRVANAPDTKGEWFGEVWLYPGRPGFGPCEWGYRIGRDWCTSCDRRIMSPQPTHFAYPDNTQQNT